MDDTNRSSGSGCLFDFVFVVLFLMIASSFVVIDQRLDKIEDKLGIVSPCEDDSAIFIWDIVRDEKWGCQNPETGEEID